VNVACARAADPFLCPYCAGRRIRCACGDAAKYSAPLVQCAVCGLWAHKACEKLDFGRLPARFVCRACDPADKRFELAPVAFDKDDTAVPDVVAAPPDRAEVLAGVREGELRAMVAADLDAAELAFRPTVERYFKKFVVLLFERGHAFWRALVDALCAMFGVGRRPVLAALDALAASLLYAPRAMRGPAPAAPGHSDSIADFLQAAPLPRLERAPAAVALALDGGAVRTPAGLDDGAFIADLPGFLMHTDEVRCDGGIPRACLAVTDTDVVADMEGTPCDFARHIRRSFHFNCLVKLVRVDGEARAALYATRLKGPLSDEKSKRGLAIQPGGELLLPFDGELPYPIERTEWKERKRAPAPPRPRAPAPAPAPAPAEREPAKPRKPPAHVRQAPTPPPAEEESPLTLLSAFLVDDIPTLPIVLLPDREAVERYKSQLQEAKKKTRRGRLD
jgi:hypothetical protein